MLGTPTCPQVPPLASSRSALEFVHRLLIPTREEPANVAELLGE
jgi:hypothetical protein